MKQHKPEDIMAKIRSEYTVGVRKACFYLKEESGWNVKTEAEMAIKIREIYAPDERAKISADMIKEVMLRLIQEPDIQLEFAEETVTHLVNLKNGVFNTLTGQLEPDEGKYEFGYLLDISYIPSIEHKMQNFDAFVGTSFPEETKQKKKLLLQILGYVISDLLTAKSAFFLVGESNSGKSVILELLHRIFPAKSVTAIPLNRLDNRFNVARLVDSKINICTELTEKSFSASDAFKAITANEIVTAEHKGKKPFEFRLRTKLISATNIFPDIGNVEGMDAIINRMVVLLFPVSIPKEQQDKRLLEKLFDERNAIFSAALDELFKMQHEEIDFVEPDDTKRLKNQMRTRSHIVEEFLSECCEKREDAKVHFVDLYDSFKNYLEDNLIDVKMTKNQFSQRISQIQGIERGKFRITGVNSGKALHGVKGLGLKKGTSI